MSDGLIGAMMTPDQGYKKDRFDHITWAADNGCYTNPDRSLDDYLTFLGAFSPTARTRCLFATALDVVGDAKETFARSVPCFAPIRKLGYKAAYVAQDGCENDPALTPWDDFDCLFIGGTTEWKLSEGARSLGVEARKRGKWVHMGRVNSRRRFLTAANFCDSADGTFLAFGPDVNLPKVLRWSKEAEMCHQLPFAAEMSR